MSAHGLRDVIEPLFLFRFEVDKHASSCWSGENAVRDHEPSAHNHSLHRRPTTAGEIRIVELTAGFCLARNVQW